MELGGTVVAGGKRQNEAKRNRAERSGRRGAGNTTGTISVVFRCTAFNCIPKWLCAKSTRRSSSSSSSSPLKLADKRAAIFTGVNSDKLNRTACRGFQRAASRRSSAAPRLPLSSVLRFQQRRRGPGQSAERFVMTCSRIE